METASMPRETRHHDAIDVRAPMQSMQDGSKEAIATLNALIARNGEHADLATEMRDVFAGFHQLADDIRTTADFVDAALRKA